MNTLVVVEAFVAFVLAVTLHEAAHAGMAALLGDGAPAAAGRLSLSPARQMAAVGTIVALVYSFAPSFAGLGWGRPVSVDAKRLRVGANTGLILVSLAGPLLNLLLGLGVALGLTVVPGYGALGTRFFDCFSLDRIQGASLQGCMMATQPTVVLRLDQFLYTFAVTNIVLAIINLIPLHPLDGYKVLFALLPNRQAISLRNLEPYMELMLLVLFFVVPWLAQILGIPFSPAGILINLARSIADGLAANVAIFSLLL